MWKAQGPWARQGLRDWVLELLPLTRQITQVHISEHLCEWNLLKVPNVSAADISDFSAIDTGFLPREETEETAFESLMKLHIYARIPT